MNMMYKCRQKGFTLVELMVGMAIGLFLIVGILKLYMNVRSAQSIVDDQVVMLDNARFALDTIAYDLRHSGLWGRVNEYDPGMGNINTDLLGVVAGECVPGNWVGNFGAPIAAFNENNPYAGTCAASYASGDVLEVHYALGDATDNLQLQADMVYVNSDVNQAAFFVGNVSPNVSTAAGNFQVISNLYYISNFTDVAGDGIPSLHRVSLEPGPQVVDRVLLSGVQDLQIQYGLDTDGDGLVNSYIDPNLLAAGDLINVRTVQVALVIRSSVNVPDLNTSVTANVNGVSTTYPNDGFRRYVVSSAVKLRNFKNASGI